MNNTRNSKKKRNKDSKIKLFPIKEKLSEFKLRKNKKLEINKSRFLDIRLYFISLFVLSITIGFIFFFLFNYDEFYNYEVIISLLGWTFGFFTLSISIYALILKFTSSTTLSVYIQEHVQVLSIAVIFTFIYIIEIYLLIHFISFSIKISYIIQLMFFTIPLTLLIIMILTSVIVPLLRATTTKRSLYFFEKKANLVKKEFDKHFKKSLKKRKDEKKKQKAKYENRKTTKTTARPDPLSYVIQSYQELLTSVQSGSSAKFINKYFERINNDAINIMFEIRDSSKYADPEIFKILGKLAVPSYMNYDYIRDNVIIKFNLAIEENIQYNSCILDFLEGFFIEALNSPYLNRIMAHSLENLLNIFTEVSYKEIESRKETHLFDKTNIIFLKFAQKIASLISDERYDYGDPLFRMIEQIGRITSSYFTLNSVIQGVQLYRIKELIKLNVSLQLKLNLFDKFHLVLSRVKDIYHGYPLFFSLFQEVFPAILSPKHLANQEYDPSKIKEDDIEIRDGQTFYKGYSYIYATKYNTGLLRWVIITINNLFTLYQNYIKRKNEEKKPNIFHPYIEQMNRVFIDLVFIITNLKPTDKFDAEFFINNILNHLYQKIMDIGEDLLQKDVQSVKYNHLLALSIIIGDFIAHINEKKDRLNILQKHLNTDFGLLTVLGINVINCKRENKDLLTINKDLLKDKIELIEKTFLKKHIFPFEGFKGTEFIANSIETRQGSWEIIGYQIGSYILEISYYFYEDPIIFYYITNLRKEIQKSKKQKPTSIDEIVIKTKDKKIDENNLFKELLALLPATKSEIKTKGLLEILKKLKENNQVFYDKHTRKWKLIKDKEN